MTSKKSFLALISTIILVGGCMISKSDAKIITFKEETEYHFKNSTFTASPGWTLNTKNMALACPENDLTMYFVQMPFVGDVEELALKAWKTVDPDFNFKVLQKSTQPAHDGWEQIHGIQYDVPATESIFVAAQIRVFQGIAYINLLNGSLAGISRRGAQIGLAISSWRPEGLEREGLSAKKAKIFSGVEAQELSQFIEESMKKLDVPGVAIQIVQDNKIVFSKGFGVVQKGSTIAITPQTLFMIGSITKSLTSLMMAKLVDLGKISWDEQVIKAFPYFTLADTDLTEKLLMKHTVSANTGMPRRDAEILFVDTASGENAMKQMATMSPTTDFGETFQYSNHLVALGGFAAAHVYKKTGTLSEKYNTAMQELIFNPLGMNDTFVYPTEQSQPLMASPHALNFNGQTVFMPQEHWVYPYAPAGSIWSNVKDMSKYILLELNKGLDAQGNRLISEEQILTRRTPGIKISEDVFYGLGMFVAKTKGLHWFGHDGSTMGFTSDLFFLPEHNLGAVILTNAAGANSLTGAIKQRLFELLFDAKPNAQAQITAAIERKNDSIKLLHKSISADPASTAWIEEYIGSYHNADLGTFTITKTDNGFELDVKNHLHSLLGSKKDVDGTLLISLISEPFVGISFQAKNESVKKLILDMDQMKYEFVQIK